MGALALHSWSPWGPRDRLYPGRRTLALATAPEVPAYLDTSLPLDAARDGLGRPPDSGGEGHQLRYDAPAIPRLGVPAYNWWNEGLHGVARAGRATVFPQPIGLAATFDSALIHRVATAIGTEARAKHHEPHATDGAASTRGSPSGRRTSTSSVTRAGDAGWRPSAEDPYLAGRLAVAFVRGMQGDDPRWLRTIATPKHFACTPGLSPIAIASMPWWMSATCAPPTSPPSRRPSRRAAPSGDVRLQPRLRRSGMRERAAARADPARGVAVRRLRGLATAGRSPTSTSTTASRRTRWKRRR